MLGKRRRGCLITVNQSPLPHNVKGLFFLGFTYTPHTKNMSLFLKYRPQTFSDLVGQEAVRRTLQNALKAERPSHAYLFTGSRGTGKTSTARIFAKGLNCENLQDGDPCGKCRFCTGTADGTLIDVIEIDAASNRGIDEIRDLREKINFAPNVAKRKVYIIDEVHMMTKEAFNALLKTLEEPPDHAFFCLATTEIHKVPETIRSRCQTFSFQRFTLEQLVDRLRYIAQQETIEAEDEALNLIARKAEGGLRDAISLLEQVSAEIDNKLDKDRVQLSLGISDSATLENLYNALLSGDSQAGLQILRHLSQNGLDFRSFGHDFLGYLREKMLNQLGQKELGFTLQCIDEFEQALQRLKTSPIIELPLEIAIINLTQNPSVTTAKNTPSTAQTTPAKPAATTAKAAPPERPQPTPTETPAPDSPATKPQSSDGFVFEGGQAPAPAPETTVADAPSAAAAKPEPVAPPQRGEALNAGNLKRQMENIARKAGVETFAKKSFMTCTPSVAGSIITFSTSSEFHREKIDEAKTKSALAKAIAQLFDVEGYQIRFIKTGTTTAAPKEEEKASVDDFLNF